MKKIIKIIFIFAISILFTSKINAETLSISASSNTVYVGSTITVTVRANDVMGAYKLSSSDSSILSGGDENTIDSGDSFSKSYTFTAKKAGSVVIALSPRYSGALYIYSSEKPISYNRTISITVKNKNTSSNQSNNKPSIDINKTYNKNNYLNNLTVEGYDLDPKFDKNTLEYTVELEPGSTEIDIKATLEDNSASIKGDGKREVSEGINTLEVVVIAENGNERIYKIIATVEEKDPIIVKIENEEYTVVKKRELIEEKDGYKLIDININDFDIPALYNEVTKVTLVGLKDKDGNVKLYSYDTKTGEYKVYKELSFDLMNLYIYEDINSPYNKIKIKINDEEVVGYEIAGTNDYYLIYAINTTTGNEGYYLYDTKENSVQRYDTTMLDKLTKENDKYLSIILVMSSACFIMMLFMLILLNKNKKGILEIDN